MSEELKSMSLDATVRLDVAAKAVEGQEQKRPTFEIDAYNGGAMKVGYWGSPVAIDTAGLQADDDLTILLDHDSTQIVGQGRATIADGKVTVKGTITGDFTDKADPAGKVAMQAKGGFKWKASVGVDPVKYERVDAGATASVNGQEMTGPLYVIRAGRLAEVSFVSIGADKTASARVAAKLQKEQTMSEEQKKVEAGAGNEPEKKVNVAMKTVDGEIQERKRQEAIEAKAAELIAGQSITVMEQVRDIAAQCVEDNCSVNDAEVKMLRAMQPKKVNIISRSRNDKDTPEVLAAAMLLACGVNADKLAKDRDIGEQAVEAGYKKRDMTIHGLIAAALRADGVEAPHGGPAIFRAAVEHGVRAGFSTINLPGIIGTVGNKLLLDAFNSVQVTYETLAQQSSYANFLTYTQYRLNHDGQFSRVAEDGELKHGSLSETSYTNKLETEGTMLTLTRQAIVNDDMNAFQQLYGGMGKVARMAVEKAFIEAVMESSDSFYTADQGNLLSSTDLSVAGLGAAEAAMMGMVDSAGNPIFATPKYLLVPAGSMYRARQLFTSATVVEAATAGEPQGVNNPYQGVFQPYTSPFMTASALDGHSTSTWYVLSDPNLLPAFQVAYLNGNRQPTIETADAAFNTLGLQMRCFFDFGVAQVDYRGAVKVTV